MKTTKRNIYIKNLSNCKLFYNQMIEFIKTGKVEHAFIKDMFKEKKHFFNSKANVDSFIAEHVKYIDLVQKYKNFNSFIASDSAQKKGVLDIVVMSEKLTKIEFMLEVKNTLNRAAANESLAAKLKLLDSSLKNPRDFKAEVTDPFKVNDGDLTDCKIEITNKIEMVDKLVYNNENYVVFHNKLHSFFPSVAETVCLNFCESAAAPTSLTLLLAFYLVKKLYKILKKNY